jgi:hypothetical protein
VYTYEWSVVSDAKLKNAAFAEPAAKAKAAQAYKHLFIRFSLLCKDAVSTIA